MSMEFQNLGWGGFGSECTTHTGSLFPVHHAGHHTTLSAWIFVLFYDYSLQICQHSSFEVI